MSEKELYAGRYTILPDVSTLAQRRLPGRGDILRHSSGAVVLRCPKCSAIQFTRANVLNSPDTPTLDRPIQCGAGHCKKCGIWFQIINGHAGLCEAPPPKPARIPMRLSKAGVKQQPKLKINPEK